MSSLLGVIISARVIMLAARAIISDIGTYYAVSTPDTLPTCGGQAHRPPRPIAVVRLR